ncbi:hypothetical protein CHS0354_036489 [Potamilus streckersoni]|uniref:FIST C-domain domain-containing protein n=1 Tax=Potamilus streckersoni TaxID=2493646 RepID=A0AAE0S3S7_9BIVA|nr:hypothetical protein CHS0354_036489 [Potamilus streckersoni]
MDPEEPDVNESYVLTCIHTVINNVLNCMTAQELNICARVCKCWWSAVHVIKEKRQQRNLIKWLSVEVGDEKDNPTLINQIQDFFKYELVTLKVKVPARSQSNRPKRATKFEKLEFKDFVQSLLPNTCKFIGIATEGVIGTSSNLEKIQEVEGEKFMSLLCIPRIKGVDILTKSADITENDNITTFIPKEKTVKTILFFCDDPRCPQKIGNTLRDNYEGAIIAGGYIDCHISPDLPCGDRNDSESRPIYVSCVAFCGENLHCASIVLEHSTHTPQEIEEKILKLKGCGLPEEKSFAFMFACVARGKAFHQKENVESSIFQKHFPKTPLFGFFGNGEIGFTHLTDARNANLRLKMEEGQSKKRLPKLHHSYSSVFCLVSVM